MHSTATRFTLREVVAFCLKYGRKGFPEHDIKQIMHVVLKANESNKLHIVADDNDIIGICISDVFDDMIYIHHLVCIRSGFRTFVQEASKLFPGREIRGERQGKLKIYWKA